ncbi:MAG: acyl-CoA thioesterase [Proteobacteria bacterium]|nr:acyl-CoA thioesterase [Pseudomonadota bacterium]
MLTHTTTYRVRYFDTDKMGFAYHANYFRWFEIGRSELFRHLGLSYKEIETQGCYLPLSEIHCKFKSPSEYDDLLVIETTLDPEVKAVMKFEYQIYTENGKKLLATGFTKHACVDRNGRVIRPPGFLVEAIRKSK